ncbi:response regulator [Teichococcus aestuarii]|uniref:response regulator n=1 Tax=Teichococcus aestuarii TaxID=568898 RepID=UPI00361E61A6
MAPTLLIVDDSKLARIVAAKAVAALQPEWRRVEAGSAAEALARRPRGRGCGAGGLQHAGAQRPALAAEMRALYPDMPVALLTANVQDEIIAQARALKLAFVPKPATEEGLRGFLAAAALRWRQGAA